MIITYQHTIFLSQLDGRLLPMCEQQFHTNKHINVELFGKKSHSKPPLFQCHGNMMIDQCLEQIRCAGLNQSRQDSAKITEFSAEFQLECRSMEMCRTARFGMEKSRKSRLSMALGKISIFCVQNCLFLSTEFPFLEHTFCPVRVLLPPFVGCAQQALVARM